MFDYDRYGNAFVDMRLHRLRVEITEQCDQVFDAEGILVSSVCVSVVLYLKQKGGGSIARIAEELGYSHQLINHRLQQLEKHGLTRRVSDVRDRRKWRIKLTTKGERQADLIETVLPRIAGAFDKLFEELDVELSVKLDRIRGALSKNPLADRLVEGAARQSA